jgi:hypothetical protein
VTLLLACAVVGMWVRSYFALESVEFTFGGMDHVVQPIVGSIITLHKSPSTSHPVIWVSTPLQDPDRKHWMKGNLGYHSDQWLRREWGGFVFSDHFASDTAVGLSDPGPLMEATNNNEPTPCVNSFEAGDGKQASSRW